MRARYTQPFRMQAIEKALSRSAGIGLREIANDLGVGYSTLYRWVTTATQSEFEPAITAELTSMKAIKKEKRPQDWSLEERLEMIISCGTLDDEAVSELCRAKGLYPHHVKQWKLEFINGAPSSTAGKSQSASNRLKHENRGLKKELNRKDKALAETAALLVLQKKVDAIWGTGEDNSQ